ncbi:MAG: Crp/Fnr family transcriptional regulator [Anaerolineae bacterium]
MGNGSATDPLGVLAKAPLFRGLSEDELRAALQVAHHCRVRRHAFFFHQEEEATTCYVLLKGRVRLSQLTPEGHQVIIRFMGPGDGMGIIVVLSNIAYPLSAEAVTDCHALAWDADTMIKLMERMPRLAVSGMQLIAGRFQELQKQYRELATERVERRVARALIRLTRQVGKRVDEGVLLDLPLSRQDLAEMTGTTLYTVSRILSKWEHNGLIGTGRERVLIHTPHALITIAEDLPTPPKKSGSTQ